MKRAHKTRAYHLTMPALLHKMTQQAAKAEDIPMSSLIRRAIYQYLATRNQTEKR